MPGFASKPAFYSVLRDLRRRTKEFARGDPNLGYFAVLSGWTLRAKVTTSCSPGCGRYLEECARKQVPIYSFVVFLIALRWIYLGVMFYRKIGTGPLVVARPLAHVVVCDEDEESPQAHRK